MKNPEIISGFNTRKEAEDFAISHGYTWAKIGANLPAKTESEESK